MAAEAIVPMIVEKLGELILKQAAGEIDLLRGIEKKVQNLSNNFKNIQGVLTDADTRRITEESVKVWVQELEDVSYEMEDVLDEWNYLILKKEIERTNNGNVAASSSINKQPVCSFIPSSCFCFKQALVNRDIALKIKELNGRLELIEKRKESFSFVISSGVISNSQEWKRIPTTSLVDESEVLGRDSEKESLLSQLLPSGEQGKIANRMLALTGTGGIGKTTLAQLAYNDDKVKGHFEKIAWVCVSDPFDEIRIAKAILESLESSSPNLNELNTLQERIKNITSGKKILLVLDDVWTEDERHWDLIKCPLKDCAPGSRILVTTRNKMVAIRAGAIPIDLGVLPPLESWSLFKHIAFAGGDGSECERLEVISKEIAEKCGGLPLAIKAIASVLRCKKNIDYWQKFIYSNMWKLKEPKIEIFPHLYLSFNALSPQMKRCFLYCAVFPKDKEIKVDDLIRLWMAQGYLNSSGSEHEMEENGMEVFENLAMRSFFQNFKIDDNGEQIIWCKMHDIMHDFAQHLTKGEWLIVDEIRAEKFCKNVRHITSSVSEGSIGELFGSSIVQLRSFFADYLDLGSLNTHLLNNLKRVRVLKLDSCNLKELPSEIGDLIHLRYLRMQDNYSLKKLPTTVYDLYNLQTLDVSGCNIDELPLGIQKLIGLRHLINSRVMKLPVGVGQIKCLQTLSSFKVQIGYIRLGDLKNLNQLRGSLTIHICNNLDDLVDAQNADLKSKKHIKDLEFNFESSIIVTEDVIEALEPPPHLKSLGWFRYNGKRLPKWIMSLTNLKELILHGCFNLVSLPPLGSLPCLEMLQIKSVGLEVVGASFLGINEPSLPLLAIRFPKLTCLEFSFCEKWKEWEDIGRDDEIVAVMPRLRRLSIRRCGMLKALPLRLLRKMSSLEYIEVNSEYGHYNYDYGISPSMFFAIAETLEEIIDGQSKYQSPSTKEASHSQIKPTHPTLQPLIYSNDKEVLREACMALSFLSKDIDNKVQALIEAGVCQRLLELLLYPSQPVAIAALQTIGNIVRGDYYHIQSMIHQILRRLQSFLTCIPEDLCKMKKEELVCEIISALIARNNCNIQDIIDAGLIPTLVNMLLSNTTVYVRKEAARAIMNATSGATYEQIKFLESHGCVKALCDPLQHWYFPIIILCLQGLENIFEVGEVEKNLGKIGDLNYFAQLIDEIGGLERIKELQSHWNTEIQEKAKKILDTCWVEKGETSHQGN